MTSCLPLATDAKMTQILRQILRSHHSPCMFCSLKSVGRSSDFSDSSHSPAQNILARDLYSEPGESEGFITLKAVEYSSQPLPHRQQVDCLAQNRVNIRVDLIRKLGRGMLQEPLSHCCRHTSLGQKRCKRFPQIVELQIGQSCLAAYLRPFLRTESVRKQQFLTIWKRSNIVR